ncbi:MAG: hypothetical protein U1E05_16655, partial [Patescibacteria group bacterium]|nr:hypothetical protein [Patescibacteria group bacterium]
LLSLLTDMVVVIAELGDEPRQSRVIRWRGGRLSVWTAQRDASHPQQRDRGREPRALLMD